MQSVVFTKIDQLVCQIRSFYFVVFPHDLILAQFPEIKNIAEAWDFASRSVSIPAHQWENFTATHQWEKVRKYFEIGFKICTQTVRVFKCLH